MIANAIGALWIENPPGGYPKHVVFLRWFFVLLLLVTGIGKLLDNRGFAEIVGTYRVFPEALLLPLALALSLAEVALAVWLVSGARLVAASFATLIFHVGYVSWLVLAYRRGLDIQNCGCFGVFWARPLTGWRFVEDAVLLSAAVLFFVGAWSAATQRKAAPAGTRDRAFGRL